MSKKITGRPNGRPREDHVPASLGMCPVHGEVEFRSHKIGKNSKGQQRWRRRCPLCHTERVKQSQKR